METGPLSYVLVTPYTIGKAGTRRVSYTRLLSRLDIELVGAQMIAPDENLHHRICQLGAEPEG